MQSVSKEVLRYFVTFIDDFTRKTFVFFMKAKTKVAEKFLEFKKLTETETGCKICRFRSDNGGEYVNQHLEAIFKRSRVAHEKTAPYCPEQNGVSERAN